MGIGAILGIIFGVFFYTIIFTIISAVLAKQRNINPGLGAVLGFFFGLIGVLIVLCLDGTNNNSNKKIQKESKNNGWECPNCKTINKEDNEFCPKCGTKKPVKELLSANWICPKCNTNNDGSSNFCVKCGTQKPKPVNVKDVPKEDMFKCDMCDSYTVNNYYAKIVDKMGTRFRNICPECVNKYKAEVIKQNVK